MKPWDDEYEMEGNILDCMAKGIGESKKAVVFVMEDYIRKAEDEANHLGKRDNCYENSIILWAIKIQRISFLSPWRIQCGILPTAMVPWE